MKTIHALFIAFVISIQFSSAQYILEIKKKNTSKSRILRVGAKIYYEASTSTLIKGKIELIKENSIVVYNPDSDLLIEEIQLIDIEIISKLSRLRRLLRVIGSPLVVVGGGIIIGGVYSLPKGGNLNALVVGTAFMAIGFLPYLFKPRTYNLRKNYYLQTRLK